MRLVGQMMTGSTGKAEQNEMYRRMEEGGGHDGRDIRVCLSAFSRVRANLTLALLCDCSQLLLADGENADRQSSRRRYQSRSD